jgi:hypothetical protein
MFHAAIEPVGAHRMGDQALMLLFAQERLAGAKN